MMKTSSEYRELALAKLSGNWGMAVAIAAIYLIVCIAIGCISALFGSPDNPAVGQVIQFVLQIFIAFPLAWGLCVAFLNFYRGKELKIDTLFDGFKDYSRIFLTMLLMNVYIFLWTLLLIVPGIIKSYSYIMTPYILKDTDLKGNAAIEKSMAMMDGHKMDLFVLHLTFIGWAILSIITCGIGFLFLVPYVQTAQAAFYEDLKNADSVEWVKEN